MMAGRDDDGRGGNALYRLLGLWTQPEMSEVEEQEKRGWDEGRC